MQERKECIFKVYWKDVSDKVMICKYSSCTKKGSGAFWVLELSLQIENQQHEVWFSAWSLMHPHLSTYLQLHPSWHAVQLRSVHSISSIELRLLHFLLFLSRCLESSVTFPFRSDYFTRVLPKSLYIIIVMFFFLVLVLSL